MFTYLYAAKIYLPNLRIHIYIGSERVDVLRV